MEKTDILIVDDKPGNLIAMEALLEDEDTNIIKAESGNAALGLLLEYDFALVILDIQMPEMDGIETARIMRKNKQTSQIPIIFVTAINKEEHQIFEGYNAGAVDYIFKPFEPLIFKSKINVLLQLYRQRKTIEQNNRQLKKMVCELENANRTILNRHKTQIEEERLKVILQLAGATAYEMNQPLMQLLNSIELLSAGTCDPDNQSVFLAAIKKSGEHIYKIAKRLQSMQNHETDPVKTGEDTCIQHKDLTVLIACSSQQDTDHLSQLLEKDHPLTLCRADSVKHTLDLMTKEKIDLIITDYRLTDGTGFDLMDMLKQKDFYQPVIFVTSCGDETIAARALKDGAYDYITRAALDENILIKTIFNALEKQNLQREIAGAYQRLAVLSTRDSLTRLYNRRYFDQTIETEISKVKRYGSELSVCMIDLDNFKQINDQFGHLVGDKVLSKTAGILNDMVRECDVACRYGGEEFGLILPKTYSRDAFLMGERIRKSIAGNLYKHDKTNIGVTVSIGIASYNQEKNSSISCLIHQADMALYNAKAKGRNRVEVFSY
ncbi:MAG: diguanylate cyclase [Pseudomonadota bacterium]